MGGRLLTTAAMTTLRELPSPSFGDKCCLSTPEGGRKLSYAQTNKEIERCLAALANAGVGPGSVVSIALPNGVPFIVSFLATTWARGIAAPLNSTYTEEEFFFYMEDAKSKVVIVPDNNGVPNARAAAVKLGIPVWEIKETAEEGVVLVPSGSIGPAVPPTAPTPDDVALFLHTSGTTSRPKGVPLTHKNLLQTLNNIQATYDLTKDDSTLLVMPLFHVHGLMCALLTSFFVGAKVAIPPAGRFSASTFWKHIAEEGVNWYTAVPTIHQVLLMRADTDFPKDNPPKLRFIRSCSSSLAPAVLEGLEAKFFAPVLEAYAMTEAAHQMTSNPLPAKGTHKPGSVGIPQNVQVAILDNNCTVLPHSQVGEVCIQGSNVTKGYLNNESANKEAFAGGWFHTGDQGYLDTEGYLFLTGRIKELINRGGEKISPLELDAAMLAMPQIGEAVAFSMPDKKYGEEVAAAVVLKEGQTATVEEIQKFVSGRLSEFKVPKAVFIAPALPRTATGKIQRRKVAEFFLNSNSIEPATDGYTLISQVLKHVIGIDTMYGVIGIPVTQLSFAAQKQGIRFISCRNEQAASYAAGAAGFLSQGLPGVCLTVSGPGMVHALAGLANATANCFPMILLSGACNQSLLGKGAFQELDQVQTSKQLCKASLRITSVNEIPSVLSRAAHISCSGRPGGVYVDLPSDVLHGKPTVTLDAASLKVAPTRTAAAPESVTAAVNALKASKRPLLVIGKGCSGCWSEKQLQALVEVLHIPFLAMPMAKGLISDDSPYSASAARSKVLKESDVVLVIGARLNWMLHHGAPPRWSETATFIQVDACIEEMHSNRNINISLCGDIPVVLDQLLCGINNDTFTAPDEWSAAVTAISTNNGQKLAQRVKQAPDDNMDFHKALSIIKDNMSSLEIPPVLVSEGANTMDIGRLVLPSYRPRGRLDAGTWGTMGIGLGYSIAAATANYVDGKVPLVVAVEGDSAFGFSGMEVETLVRYQLPVIIIIFNNGGIYGGKDKSNYDGDLAPTSFVPNARYDLLAQAFGGAGYDAPTAQALTAALKEAFAARKPAVVNVHIDPSAGTESGSLKSHN